MVFSDSKHEKLKSSNEAIGFPLGIDLVLIGKIDQVPWTFLRDDITFKGYKLIKLPIYGYGHFVLNKANLLKPVVCVS